MSCSGLYTDVRKSESNILDNIGWKKIKQSYIRYLGNDLESIHISNPFFHSEGKILVLHICSFMNYKIPSNRDLI